MHTDKEAFPSELNLDMSLSYSFIFEVRDCKPSFGIAS